MRDDDSRFRAAIERFDKANAADPNRTVVAGESVADELLYARRMTDWLNRLEPAASEPLRLAVRCQHLCRWMIPRSQYPMTRAGYLQWRSTLAQFHADKAGEILHDLKYDEETVRRVKSLVRKEGLKSDSEAQTLEDVACLVFLEFYFADFAAEHEEAKVLNILRRTWAKMSERGRDAAKTIDLPQRERELIAKALTPPV